MTAFSTELPQSLIDRLREKMGSGVVALAGVQEDRPFFVVGVTRDLVERGVRADQIVREMSVVAGGKGGGRPDMAQGGGHEPSSIGAALDRAAAVVRELMRVNSRGDA